MKYLSSIFLVLIGCNFIIFNLIFISDREGTDIYFMDVGQGDAALVRFEGGVKFLIDGGPGKEVLSRLYQSLSPGERYLDAIILSHAQMDHFGGFIDILERFDVGAFIWNGRGADSHAWKEFMAIIKEKNVRSVVLKEGSVMKYGSHIIEFISPDSDLLKSKDLNDTTLVAMLESEDAKVLFTGDIGVKIEKKLIKKYNLDADILKVGHHGSRYSSDKSFLEEVSPAVSVISVGKNRYGHPTEDVISRLANILTSLYRTDKSGTIRININDGVLNVFSSP